MFTVVRCLRGCTHVMYYKVQLINESCVYLDVVFCSHISNVQDSRLDLNSNNTGDCVSW